MVKSIISIFRQKKFEVLPGKDAFIILDSYRVPNRDVGFVDGNITELGDVCGTPGKSSLFFLTAYYPESRLPGDRVTWQGEHFKS
jgi:hypothetical protein